MLTYSSRELQDSGRDFLNYVGNDRLLRYLTDENEITLLVNLYKTELLILSLPVFTGVEYDFKRVLLIDEEDTETMVLVYQEELLSRSKVMLSFSETPYWLLRMLFMLLYWSYP